MLTHPSFEVLVVEDDRPTFDLLQRLAERLFPEATFVCSPSLSGTIDYLNTNPGKRPRLILLDIDLHSTADGLTMLPELRTRFKGQVPIIMLTVSERQEHVRQSYTMGATAYTTKPTSLEGWKAYIDTLKSYWYETNALPS
ncbi:response regulator [Spirosoma gilvum]